MNSNKFLAWFAWALCLAVALILSIRNLREPDLWWMLRTGEWIVAHGKVIDTDQFSFTRFGTPWINVKWLFEVIVFLVNKAAGPEFILFLQTLTNAAIVILIHRIYKTFRQLSGHQNTSSIPDIGLILATYLALFGWEFRMVGRPEMTSHLFLMLYIWVYSRFRATNGNIIFLLIPLQLLWTNLHEAFGIGLVVMIAMLAGYWFEKNYIEKAGFQFDLKKLTLATFEAIAAISINPHGPRMILHPFEIFGQVGDNKFTTELLSYKTNYYWQQKEAWLLMLLVLLASVGFFLANRTKTTLANSWKQAFAAFGYGQGVLLVLFFYLALTAHRNVVFFVLMSAPFVAFALNGIGKILIEKFSGLRFLTGKAAYGLLIVFGLSAYVAVGSNIYYQKFNPRENFGLLVAPNKNPVGGSAFLKQNHTVPGNIYSDYLTSSYFMWENRPEFKTYVDLRDLDVFPAEFITQATQELYYPEIWEQANAKYQFKAVALYQAIAPDLHKYLYQSPNWQLVFADPVVAIYKLVAAKTAQTDVFKAPFFREPSTLAATVSRIFWPVYSPQMPPHDNIDVVASRYYKSVGNIELALNRTKKLAKNPETVYESLIETGEIYLVQAQKTPGQAKLTLLKQAETSFEKAQQQFRQKPGGFAGTGKILILKNDAENARINLEKALELTDKPDLVLYTSVAQAIGMQIEAGNETLYPDWFKYMRKAYDLDPENEQVKFVIGLTYCNRGDCKNAAKFLEGVTGYPGVSQQELQMVQQCKLNCQIK